MTNKILAFPKTLARLKEVAISHKDYEEIIANIGKYEISIINTDMPALNFPPSDVEEILKDRQAILNALNYFNTNVLTNLSNCPGYIKEQLERLCEETKKALEYVEGLEKCTDEEEYNHLVKNLLYSLEDMMRPVGNIESELSNCISHIEKFKGKVLDEAYANMEDLVNRLKNDEKVDQTKIDKLMEDIHALNNELNSAVAALAASCVGMGASITLITLAAVCCGAVGGLLIGLFLGIPVIISGVSIALNSVKIENCKIAIEADQNELNLYEKDIASLQVMEEQYGGFMNGISELRANVSVLHDVWAEVANEILEMSEWIDDHNEKGEIENWADMKDGLNGIISECSEISQTMEVLDISDMWVSNASIELGMSAEEIEKAVNDAETVSFLEYVKAV